MNRSRCLRVLAVCGAAIGFMLAVAAFLAVSQAGPCYTNNYELAGVVGCPRDFTIGPQGPCPSSFADGPAQPCGYYVTDYSVHLVLQHHFLGMTFGCLASQVFRCDFVACLLRSR